VDELETLDIFPDPNQYSDAIGIFYDELKSIGGATVKQELPLEGAGSCGAGINILSIAANGDVYPCQSLHFDKFLIGNIRKNRVSEIFEKSISKWEHREEIFPRFESCLQCELESICASKCHVYQNLFEKDDALFFSRMCPFFKSELDLKLWREVESQENLSC
jgi:radical SAM protein with 4Fe4S-binding SPASM domain